MKNYLLVLVAFALPLLSLAREIDEETKLIFKPSYDVSLYNFFTGPDNGDFTTTIDGFGSGFMFDVISMNSSAEMVTLPLQFNVGLGFSIRSYRFSNNIFLNKTDEAVTYTINETPGFIGEGEEYAYSPSFFSHDKTKMVLGSFIVPVKVFIPVSKNVAVHGGVYLDLYLSGKYKQKYHQDGEKKKFKIGNDEFNSYHLNKTNFFWTACLRLGDMDLGYRQAIKPLFKEGHGPEIYENSIFMVFYAEELFNWDY